jgi:hypothetical protein
MEVFPIVLLNCCNDLLHCLGTCAEGQQDVTSCNRVLAPIIIFFSLNLVKLIRNWRKMKALEK